MFAQELLDGSNCINSVHKYDRNSMHIRVIVLTLHNELRIIAQLEMVGYGSEIVCEKTENDVYINQDY